MKKMNYGISNFSAHKVFLFTAIVWGVIMIFLVPPYQVPDEPAHFYRAYQVSQFKFLSEIQNNRLGGELPASFQNFYKTVEITPGNKDEKLTVEMLKAASMIQLKPEETKFYTFPNTALYSPIPYIPQSIGIFTGRLFKLSPLIIFYLARLSNLTVWILLVFAAIKIVPFKKWLFLILVLTPMSVHLAGSASADVLLNAVSLLFIALTFKIAFQNNTKPDFRNLALLTVLAVVIAFSKNIYVLLAGLFFIIPVQKSVSRKNHLKNVLVLFGSSIFAFVVSSFVVAHLMNQILPVEHFYGTENVPRINPAKQIEYIVSDIPGFLLLAIKSFTTNWYLLFSSFIGNLGWLEVTFPNFYHLIYYLAILFLSVFNGQKNTSIPIKNKIIFLMVVIFGLLAFSFTMYCSWCEPGSAVIENLQGRYFIPFAPLVPLLFLNTKFIIKKQIVFPVLAFILLFLSIGVTVFELATRYWN